MDNIGGIISAEYVMVQNVRTCAVLESQICIDFVGSKNWVEFPATPKKIQVTVTPNPQNGITSYAIDVIVLCATPKVSERNDLKILISNKILLKLTTANGEVLVVGDKEHPLKVITEKIIPTEANGYSGSKFSIQGINTHPALTLLTL